MIGSEIICLRRSHNIPPAERVSRIHHHTVCSIFNWKMSHHDGNNNNNMQSHRQRHEKKIDENSLHVQNARSSDPTPLDRRILRCFCGCSQLDFEQVEEFSMMSASALVTHLVAKPLFRNFLRIGHRTDKSNALLSLECYELCDKIINNASADNAEDVDALIELCPSYDWEERVNDAIESDKKINDKRNLRQLLHELKRECVRSIECHNDFDRFRKELLRKIGKSS